MLVETLEDIFLQEKFKKKPIIYNQKTCTGHYTYDDAWDLNQKNIFFPLLYVNCHYTHTHPVNKLNLSKIPNYNQNHPPP